jgi:hypothetical protein
MCEEYEGGGDARVARTVLDAGLRRHDKGRFETCLYGENRESRSEVGHGVYWMTLASVLAISRLTNSSVRNQSW